MTANKKNRSTSELPAQINRLPLAVKMRRNHSKSLSYSVMGIIIFLLFACSCLAFLYVSGVKEAKAQQREILSMQESLKKHEILLQEHKELIADVKNFLQEKPQRLTKIEAIINKKTFQELYQLALFYYQTKQHQKSLNFVSFGLMNYKGQKNKRFQLLKWLIEKDLGQSKNNVRDAYLIAQENQEDLGLLLWYALENNEYALQKNIYRKFKKTR